MSVRSVLLAVTVLIAIVGVMLLSFGVGEADVTGWWPAFSTAVLTAAIGVAGRRHPQLTVVAATVTAVTGLVWSGSRSAVVPLTLASALAAAQAWPRLANKRRRVALLVVSTAVMASAAMMIVGRGEPPAVVVGTGLWVVGLNTVVYHLTVPVLTERTRRTRLQRSLDAAAREIAVRSRRAVRDERVRIARDLHDSAGHLVTVVNIHATAAERALDRDPDQAAEAISSVTEYSRQALLEIQTVLRVLDGKAEDSEPEPGLEALDAMVDEVEALGLSVATIEVGGPVPLPPTVSTVAYRVLREGLINVRKHSAAPGARAIIRWPEPGIRDDVLEIEVVDDGPARTASTGSGIGLRGLGERVELENGSMVAGRLAGGGFHICARLPIDHLPASATTPSGELHDAAS